MYTYRLFSQQKPQPKSAANAKATTNGGKATEGRGRGAARGRGAERVVEVALLVQRRRQLKSLTPRWQTISTMATLQQPNLARPVVTLLLQRQMEMPWTRSCRKRAAALRRVKNEALGVLWSHPPNLYNYQHWLLLARKSLSLGFNAGQSPSFSASSSRLTQR